VRACGGRPARADAATTQLQLQPAPVPPRRAGAEACLHWPVGVIGALPEIALREYSPRPMADSPKAPPQPSAATGDLSRRDVLVAALPPRSPPAAACSPWRAPSASPSRRRPRARPQRFPLGLPSDFKARTVNLAPRARALRPARREGLRRLLPPVHAPGLHRAAHGHRLRLPVPRRQVRRARARHRRSRPRPLSWFHLWQEADGRILVDLAKEASVGTAYLAPPGKEGA
jgi:hypothetical protein